MIQIINENKPKNLREITFGINVDYLKPWFAERVFHFARFDVSQLENLFFWNSEITFKNSRKDNEMEWNSDKMQFDPHQMHENTMFAERVFHFAKCEVS